MGNERKNLENERNRLHEERKLVAKYLKSEGSEKESSEYRTSLKKITIPLDLVTLASKLKR